MDNNIHKAGFVSIVGKPNVGKSTLMNELVGERLSIITSKAQTTRHRIMGIINGDDFQVIYSDTPGVIKPQYALQKSMMKFVTYSLEDADVVLLVKEAAEVMKEEDEEFHQSVRKHGSHVILVLNKIDMLEPDKLEAQVAYWKEAMPEVHSMVMVSALRKINVDGLFQAILDLMPEHPAYYDKDSLTDKPERFFAAEIVREKIFLNYKKEIPYSCEVIVSSFKEDDDIIRIRAEIYCERDSQKGILIGHKGEMLKKVGIESRAEMEKFFQKKIHIETHVKVAPDWRTTDLTLKRFGYEE